MPIESCTIFLACFSSIVHNSEMESFTTNLTENATVSEEFSIIFKHEGDATLNLILQIWYSAIAVVGIFGNTLTILAILICKKHHTTQNVYICSLAFSDLLVCTLSAPYSAWLLTNERELARKSLTSIVCQAIGVTVMISVGSTMYHLAAIAVNRYICILKPAHVYMALYTKGRVVLSIVLMWSMCVIMVLPGIFGFGSFGYNDLYGNCIFTNDKETSLMLFTVMVAPCTVPCLSLIQFSYTKIILHFRNVSRKLRAAPKSIVSTVAKSTTQAENASSDGKQGMSKSNRQAKEASVVANLCVVTAVCMICWMPGNFLLLLDFTQMAPLWLHRSLIAFALSNSCVNVFIYAGMNRSFRRTYIQIILCQWRQINL